MRNRNNTPKASGLTVPLAMIDVYGLTLLFTLLKSQFMVERVELPVLKCPAEATVVAPAESQPGIQIALRANGDVIYQGEEIAAEDVVVRIATEQRQDQPILLSVETTPEGIGPLTALLQVQTDLSNAGINDRVQLLSRTTPRTLDSTDQERHSKDTR